MPQKPAQDLVEIVEKLRREHEELEAFYSEDGWTSLFGSISFEVFGQ